MQEQPSTARHTRLDGYVDRYAARTRGMVASDAFITGYDALDEWEFSDWLKRHGAGPLALDSVMVRGTSDPLLRIELPDGRVYLRLSSEVKAVPATPKSDKKKR